MHFPGEVVPPAPTGFEWSQDCRQGLVWKVVLGSSLWCKNLRMGVTVPQVFPEKRNLGTGGACIRILGRVVHEWTVMCEGDVWGQEQWVSHIMTGAGPGCLFKRIAVSVPCH